MDEQNLGRRVHELRTLRGLSMRDLANWVGVSAAYISRIENGQANASLPVIRAIADAFGVRWLDLFNRAPVRARVLRKEERPRLTAEPAVRHFAITQPPSGNVEVLMSEYEPGEEGGDEERAHGASQEICLVLRGSFRFRLGDQEFILGEGDSIEYRSSTPHMLTNIGDGVGEALWVVTPPSSSLLMKDGLADAAAHEQ